MYSLIWYSFLLLYFYNFSEMDEQQHLLRKPAGEGIAPPHHLASISPHTNVASPKMEHPHIPRANGHHPMDEKSMSGLLNPKLDVAALSVVGVVHDLPHFVAAGEQQEQQQQQQQPQQQQPQQQQQQLPPQPQQPPQQQMQPIPQADAEVREAYGPLIVCIVSFPIPVHVLCSLRAIPL